MKTSIIGVLLLLQLMIGGQALATKVKIGYFELPPHMYQGENGNEQGASVNYFNQVFKQMDYEVEWVGPLPYMRLLKMIENGEIDALPLMQESEKEPLFQFPVAPYYSPQPVIFVKKTNPLQQIQSIDDIRGLTIGFIAGVEPSRFIKTHQKELKMEYMAQKNWLELSLMKLKRNRIDAIHGLNQVSTMVEASKLGMGDDIKALPLPEPPGHMFLGVANASNQRDRIIRDYNLVHKIFKVTYEQLLTEELTTQK